MTNQPDRSPFENIAGRKEDGMTLLSYVAARLQVSRRKAKELIDSRCVLINRRRVWMCNHRLKQHDIIEIAAGIQEHVTRDLPILYSDESCIIIDKPPGLLSDGLNSAEQVLRRQLHNPQILAVHRLDRDTSGCLIFAVNAEAKRELVPVFTGHTITKLYQAIINGQLATPEAKCSEPIEGKHAVTLFRVLDSSRDYSHIQARIETGRTHQIRKHLASLGHYVVGDRYYGVKNKVSSKDIRIRRQMLHASSVEFMSPITGKRIRARAPLPGDFRKTLGLFGLS